MFKTASGLAPLPGTNPIGYEIFNAVFVWEKYNEVKEMSCKGGLTRYCSTAWLNKQEQFLADAFKEKK